jgi:hypothetical protein
MYTNIPTRDLQHIIENILSHTLFDQTERHEYLKLYNVIINKNYFTHNGNFLKQKGLAMGAPSSAFLSETYLQYIEFKYIIDIITKYNILGYFRYIDDLIIYDSMNTDIHSVLNEFNQIQLQLQFATIECENNGTVRYLDLTVRRLNNTLKFSIF